MASQYGHKGIVNALIEAGADGLGVKKMDALASAPLQVSTQPSAGEDRQQSTGLRQGQQVKSVEWKSSVSVREFESGQQGFPWTNLLLLNGYTVGVGLLAFVIWRRMSRDDEELSRASTHFLYTCNEDY